jgi:hypothetical protein
MMAPTSTNFFKKNGKYLKGLIRKRESVTSLFEPVSYETTTSLIPDPSPREIFFSNLTAKAVEIYRLAQNQTKKTFVAAKSYDLTTAWILGSVSLFLVFAMALLVFPTKLKPETDDKYSIYLSKPLTLDSNVMGIYTRDSRAQRINEVMREYNCPMEGLGEVFVSEADKNNIPWWLVASVAFQESSCGKHMPTLDGANSFNSWGWGVYGENVHVFDNWVRGIETVSSYMNEMFYSKGITDPCDIMKTYTPPSQGSWCEGVKYFGNEFQNYKTPEPEIEDSIETLE